MSTAGIWIVVAAMAVIEAAIVVAALRMRVRATEGSGLPGSRAAEVVWTLLPAGLLAAVAALSLGSA